MFKTLEEALLNKEFKKEYRSLDPHQKKAAPDFVLLNLIIKKIKNKKEETEE